MSILRPRRVLAAAGCLAVAAGLGLAAPASAGVAGPAFYVDGTTYRTVATPTDLSGTGAPAQAWDIIYDFGGAQLNVADAAPGQPGYNGGRWQVHGLSFPDGYPAAVAAGDLEVAHLPALADDSAAVAIADVAIGHVDLMQVDRVEEDADAATNVDRALGTGNRPRRLPSVAGGRDHADHRRHAGDRPGGRPRRRRAPGYTTRMASRMRVA